MGTMHEIVVGNVGSVYYGTDIRSAGKAFRSYVEISKASDTGSAGGESVVWFADGEIKKEHTGSLDRGNRV